MAALRTRTYYGTRLRRRSLGFTPTVFVGLAGELVYDRVVGLEALQALQADRVVGLEATGFVSSDRVVGLEARGAFDFDRVVGLEALQALRADRLAAIEALLGVDFDRLVGLEARGTTPAVITLVDIGKRSHIVTALGVRSRIRP